ncbi:MAG: GAF domain-containing sensor histidine kinase [Anaerolineae bacterium]|nr:GAF domain-containing sensor histidine kinase [Anaerolineae bacterium]
MADVSVSQPPSLSLRRWQARLGSLAFRGGFAVYTLVAIAWLGLGLAPVLVAFGYLTDAHLAGWGDMGQKLLVFRYRVTPLAPIVWQTGFSLLNLALGLWLVWLRPDHLVARLLAIGMVGTAAVFNLQAHEAYLVWPPMDALHNPIHAISGVAYMYALALFPNGRLPLFAKRLSLEMVTLRVGFLVCIFLIGFGLSWAGDGTPEGLVFHYGVLIPLVGIVAQALRRPDGATPEEQQQSRILLRGLTIGVGLALLFAPLTWLVYHTPTNPFWTTLHDFRDLVFLVFPGLMAVIPLTLAVAVGRYRLWDVDFLLNRTLVYGALSALVIGLYVGVVGTLSTLFQASGSLLVSLLATGLVAVLFQPLRDHLQRWVNRLVYGERDDPYTVLARLGERLEAALSPEAVLPTIVQTIRETLKLPDVTIQLVSESEPASQPPARRDALIGSVLPPLSLPLTYRGELIGHLSVGPRAPGEPLTAADRRLLEQIAHQAGVAAHAVRLTQDLQRARERLVTLREEERRRLRRDLHDGLGASLASLALQADLARDVVHADPARAEAYLTEITAQVQGAVGDIRRLVYELRPPALDELGLVGALNLQAAQLTSASLHVSLETSGAFPPLPAAVEVAAYRITQEALTNVVRHAQARRCRVSLAVQGAALVVTVADDGQGMTDARPYGVGLSSMRERAAEVGGTCEITTGPDGGTVVHARLPFGSEPRTRAGG